MLTDGVLNPWKVIAGIPAIIYALLLNMKSPSAGLVLALFVVILSAILWYIGRQGYTIGTIIPALLGLLLLLSSLAALYTGLPSTSLVPLSHSVLELWLLCLVAVAYVGWGVYETRRDVYRL